MSPRTTRRRTTTRKRTTAKRAAAKQRIVPGLMSWNLGTQVVIAVSAMALLAILGTVDRGVFSAALGDARPPASLTIDIGLEHQAPAAVDMLVARKGEMGHVEVTNSSDFPLKISLPEDWEQTEVRGGSIWSVEQEDPQMGYVRWTIPAKMTMAMQTKQVPDVMNFHSPSSATTSVRITAVDLTDNGRHDRTLLFQQGAQAKIWTDDE